jgi:AraC family transcriptional regulator of adaptative response / DNA-3-methyladenine glycosylase II
LISEAGVEDEGIERLAARLGIGSRQLRRLFLQHLGATPSAVIKTRRLHFAKKLIDETVLPFSQIADASGFGSVRRFNSAFQKTYGRTPTEIRRFSQSNRSFKSTGEYEFRLSFRPPFQWGAFLEYLSKRAIPGVESVDADSYRRTIAFNGSSGTLRVALAASNPALCVQISVPDPRWLFQIIERVRRLFDLTADPREISGHLSRDPLLAERVKTTSGLRIPGTWDGFELAVRAILGQQVSVAGASTLASRLVERFGKRIQDGGSLTHLFPQPEQLASATIEQIGLPKSRAETIRTLARRVSDGLISFDSVQDTEQFRSRLLEIPGIGDWTAQYITMRALNDTDAFPSGDLGLMRAMSLSNQREITQRAEAWRPWRAYAAMYLWQTNGAKAQSKRTLGKLKVQAPMFAG